MRKIEIGFRILVTHKGEVDIAEVMGARNGLFAIRPRCHTFGKILTCKTDSGRWFETSANHPDMLGILNDNSI